MPWSALEPCAARCKGVAGPEAAQMEQGCGEGAGAHALVEPWGPMAESLLTLL